MKLFLQLFFILDILAIAIGYYIKSQNEFQGNRVIGIAVILLAFVFMPLFIYYRYKGKDIRKYLDLEGMMKETSEIYDKKD
jgi:hypothetical protein